MLWRIADPGYYEGHALYPEARQMKSQQEALFTSHCASWDLATGNKREVTERWLSYRRNWGLPACMQYPNTDGGHPVSSVMSRARWNSTGISRPPGCSPRIQNNPVVCGLWSEEAPKWLIAFSTTQWIIILPAWVFCVLQGTPKSQTQPLPLGGPDN